MDLKRNFSKYNAATLVIMLSPIILESCSDDAINPISNDERFIRFDISANNSHETSDGFVTRGLTPFSSNIISLKGGDKPLYLIPRIEEGIDVTEKNIKTRSQLTDASNIESVGVFAGYASEAGSSEYTPNYISNVEITRSSDWTLKDEYLWPGNDKLHFNAYSPYFSSASIEGIKSVNVSPGALSIDYEIPVEVKNQIDLLYSTPVEASSSPCQLSFNHALTAIKFVSGSEMVPCTVKSITVSGVLSSGTLNLESGEWNNLSSPSDFTVIPDITLSEAPDSEYVESGTPITSAEQTFLLIPQVLDKNASISVILDVNGKEFTLSSSLESQSFPMGKTLTYRISANPDADSLILDVSGDFKTDYIGSSISFNVKSSFTENGSTTPVEWKAEYVDDNGNVISQPDWISDFTLSGIGNTTGNITTVMNDLTFEAMSSGTRLLQNASDINASSGNTPYNLSSSSGSSSIENTANTYIINAPGKYSLPLVYGNAIKSSADNKQAYAPSTHNSRALKNFTNHLNNAITSPYIYENSGCTPADAILIWEDELNLIRNVTLSQDGKSILFDVPHNTIRQGNAIVAVRDSEKNVMWSWQIWVTDYNPTTGIQNITASGKSYGLATYNLGYVEGGDKFKFPECSVKIRFTQTGLPEGTDPLTRTVTLYQTGAELSTPDYNTYYQWGRKDPMMSDDKIFYDASHHEITSSPKTDATSLSSINLLMQEYILHPDTFYLGIHENNETSINYTSYPYDNLWNGTYSTANVKTIYDPNPVGFVVPYNEPLIDFTPQSLTDPATRYTFKYNSTSTDSERHGFYVTVISSGEVLYFPDFGYISGTTGTTASSGAYANYWLSHAIQSLKTGAVVILHTINKDDILTQQTTDPLFHGMSIRGITE